MTTQNARQAGQNDPAGALVSAAVITRLTILRNRADFLRANGGSRQGMPGFLLQARKRAPSETDTHLTRVGFTCSKKVGNAVARNRAKRRLREIARLTLPLEGRSGWDYVLIGRKTKTATIPFEELRASLSRALKRIHEKHPTE